MISSTDKLQHDGPVTIAIGKNRFESEWKNRQVNWSWVLAKLQTPRVTSETMAEYDSMVKADQDNIKDVGGFVGGTLTGGRRTLKAISWRTMFTLDADFAEEGLFEEFWLTHGCACAAYNTHKDRKGKRRIRIIGPYSRSVTAEEHEAISRMLAHKVGMDQFDDTTYQPTRLMYWPSVSSDQEPYFDCNDAPWLDPDSILALYGPGETWKDSSFWPESSRIHKARKKAADKQGDPTEKTGIVGAFCRTYNIVEAIETFLPDVYAACTMPDRYTYVAGSTAAGLVIYDNDKFAYSNHGTDPIAGRLVNSFDLVRIHKFGELDESAKEGTPVNKLPSYQAMVDFALQDNTVKETLGTERLEAAREDFANDLVSTDWLTKLKYDAKGKIDSIPENILLILLNDPNLAGKIQMDDFAHKVVIKDDLPWRKTEAGRGWEDGDDSGLRNYLHRVYKIKGAPIIQDALNELMYHQHFHPVRDFLNGLEWDGKERIETLLIDYLGAEDNGYIRTVTRKMMVAAVARIMQPGVKFDTMLVLIGKQGIGKSYFLSRLGGTWFSDSIKDINHKDIYQLIQGRWIIEMGELAGLKKADEESVKHFLSKQIDHFRMPYGKNVMDCPRQCVFWGSSNRDDFIRDSTGGRRFWPVRCGVQDVTKSVFKELPDSEIGQIWAEAMSYYLIGEDLHLDQHMATVALQEQEKHMEDNEKQGQVQTYLDTLLPEDWQQRGLPERREFLNGDFITQAGAVKRDRVCVMEIWCELFGGDLKSLNRIQAIELREILNRMPGWTKYTKGTGKLYFGSMYGHQRCFVRAE
ncbi:hypothetical protein P22_1983 [Propionispora sp. 2/2-37]|uniref:virulence-associated E family protein n=1 Tax=Propionispora sp. 2/2-37 TaxID=1677858 RepID=UPI0006BB5E77|nr:virulence-associated E family protein [Propionispora sp. 2/2-37]CUH95897.1 hypothetical protein P22_1983 [Propionispora sp. 2/2-37]